MTLLSEPTQVSEKFTLHEAPTGDNQAK